MSIHFETHGVLLYCCKFQIGLPFLNMVANFQAQLVIILIFLPHCSFFRIPKRFFNQSKNIFS